MAKIIRLWIGLATIILFANFPSYGQEYAVVEVNQTQTLQIYTHFQCIIGKPTWLLIVRDVDTGLVSPYMFDIRNNDNFWLAFTYGHNYKIITSSLKFGRLAVINNFCNLENGIISGKSMYLTLTGVLTPDVNSSSCYVKRYRDPNFTIVNNDL